MEQRRVEPPCGIESGRELALVSVGGAQVIVRKIREDVTDEEREVPEMHGVMSSGEQPLRCRRVAAAGRSCEESVLGQKELPQDRDEWVCVRALELRSERV